MRPPSALSWPAVTSSPEYDKRWVDIDLSDLGLRAPLTTLDDLATAVAQIYERFVPYADDGWEWVSQPGLADFDCWTYQMRDGELVVASAHLLIRRPSDTRQTPSAVEMPHAVSAHRTRQLTQRPWTAEPGSKLWKPFSRPV